jgi:hypothetical protein
MRKGVMENTRLEVKGAGYVGQLCGTATGHPENLYSGLKL